MRVGVTCALALLASTARASAEGLEPLEAAVFAGVDYFADDIGLGDSLAPEQRPQTAPTLGGRITAVAVRTPSAAFGVEAELSLTPAWTGYGFDSGRESSFAPVFGYRGAALLRLGGGWVQPHLVAGGGAATVVSSSRYMARETDAEVFAGLGATLPVAGRWLLRVDARIGSTEAQGGGTSTTFEAQLAVGWRFGLARAPRMPVEDLQIADAPLASDPVPSGDRDGDGIPDTHDACPGKPESVNGVADDDGCPEPDPDADGIVGASDRCPDQAEDFDRFEDDDGCADDDNDRDGVADGRDACPNEPETRNGIEDEDGCDDQLPSAVLAALGAASRMRFEPNRARVTPAARAALEQALLVLLANPRLGVTVVAHPDAGGPALAQQRADAVKWYLVERGATAAQLATRVGHAATRGVVIELSAGR